MIENKTTVFREGSEIPFEENPFGYCKDGIVYWKRENGEVMKIGGSGGGKTRYFRKPDLLNNKA